MKRNLMMRPSIFKIAALTLALATAPANAAVVFSDNFNTENGGASQLNYRGFANFNSAGAGNVDLVAAPDFGITCAGGSGSCVDLDGSPGPGFLRSIMSFAFNAGDFVRLSFDLSGNQRTGGSDSYFAGFDFTSATFITDYGRNFFGSDVIVSPGTTEVGSVALSASVASNSPFTTRSIFFTAAEAGSLRFRIGSSSLDNFGPILDNVTLTVDSAVPETATWAMMLLGFAAIGGAMRSRRNMRKAISIA
jgi:hypothetical protein